MDGGLRLERSEAEQVLHLSGQADLQVVAAHWQQLQDELVQRPPRQVRCEGLQLGDTGGAALLASLRRQQQEAGRSPPWEGMAEDLEREIAAAQGALVEPPPEQRVELLAGIGAATLELGQASRRLLAFLGALLPTVRDVALHPRSLPWRHLPGLISRAGADAVPVVVLIVFLTGLILAFQSMLQLERYGTTELVPVMVSLAVVRELGPLMTAIVVAGRSGSGIAAELGTMQVGDQIDALRVNGMPPLSFLVLPRILALLLAMPVLVLLANTAGLLGGATVAAFGLPMGPSGFLERGIDALQGGDVLVGMIKCLAYALTIGVVACQRGLSASGGAKGVGASATSAVVMSLFLMILLDTTITILANIYGL